MANNLFNSYIWLVDTIYRAKNITFKEINDRWQRNALSEGNELPLRTFHNWRIAIEEIFDVAIMCDKQNNYQYYIENADDMEKGGVRTWLLNTFAVNNLINESHHLKRRILFEYIPSGQQFLTPIIEAMRDSKTIEMTYQSFSRDHPNTFEAEPWCIKVFKQRWYLVAKSEVYEKPRIYALDRIISIKVTDNYFVLPSQFDAEEYFSDAFGIIVDEDYVVEIVKLKVHNEQVRYFRTLPLHDSQKEVESGENDSVFEYYLRPTLDFQQEILSRDGLVEVLEPQWLREEICQTAKTMVNNNRK